MLCAPKTCYTCLKPNNKELVDVFKMDHDKISYHHKLETCISTKLIEIDKIKMELCFSCIKQLRVSYQFKEMVLMSQETLQQCYNEVKVDMENKSKRDNQAIDVSCVLLKQEKHKQDHFKSDVVNVDNNLNSKQNMNSTESDDESDSDYFLADLKNASEDEVVEKSCRNCKKTFNSDSELHNHICENISKDKTKDNIKSKCKKLRKSKGRPKKYNVKPKPPVTYFCEVCGSIFDKRWKLQKHTTRVHVIDKKYVCTYCNKAFKQSYHLREHLTSHTGEKNYMCNYCEKSFQRVSSLRRHIRSHEAAPGQKTKRTPFLCSVCGKSFPFSNGVQRHMRIHLGIKNHECTVCHRRFTQSTHLHVHMRTHTGEKPYVCDTCGEAFSLNASLQKHMIIHKNKEIKVENDTDVSMFLIKR